MLTFVYNQLIFNFNELSIYGLLKRIIPQGFINEFSISLL